MRLFLMSPFLIAFIKDWVPSSPIGFWDTFSFFRKQELILEYTLAKEDAVISLLETFSDII